jgi:hypothetical protein
LGGTGGSKLVGVRQIARPDCWKVNDMLECCAVKAIPVLRPGRARGPISSARFATVDTPKPNAATISGLTGGYSRATTAFRWNRLFDLNPTPSVM